MNNINDILLKQDVTNANRSVNSNQMQPDTKRMKMSHHNQPMATQYPPTSSLMETICNKLYESRQLCLKGLQSNVGNGNGTGTNNTTITTNNSIKNIEIELRIGMLIKNDRRYHHVKNSNLNNSNHIDSEFHANVDEYITYNFTKIFGKGIAKPVQKLRFNEQNKMRWEINNSTNNDTNTNSSTIKMMESKQRIVRYDISCCSYHYDIRLDVNNEIPNPIPNPNHKYSHTPNRLIVMTIVWSV